MNKKETIMAVLEKMGLQPELDEDNDIMIQFQMKTIYVMVDEKSEDPYVFVMLPQFHDVEEGAETIELAVCNKMTREYKLMKVFIDQTFQSVTATCEFYYANKKSLELSLRKSLHMLGIARSAFRKEKADLLED